jgi:hypothetical protein
MAKTEKNPEQLLLDRALMTARAQKIREAVRGRKLSPTEQDRVAENLWRILQDAEEKGFKKAAVLHAGGAGGEGDSTKRLSRFALDPDQDVATKKERASRLAKGVKKYLEIAEAAGALAKKDRDAYVVDLFNGTGFTAPTDGAETEDLYVELSDMIRFICSGVARKHNLQRLFKICDERSLCYFDRSPRRNPDDQWSKFWRSFVDGGRVTGLIDYHGQHSMPYPSVLIGWTDLASNLPFRILPDPDTSKHLDPIENDTLRGSFKLEVRLSLLPLGPGGTVEPAFITSCWTAIEFGRMTVDDQILSLEHREVHSYRSSFGVSGNLVQRDLPGKCWHEGWSCLPQFEPPAWEAAHKAFEGLEPGYRYGDEYASGIPLRIELVSPSSCRRYLSLIRAESPEVGVECETIIDDLDPAFCEVTTFEERHKLWKARSGSLFHPPEALVWRSEPGSLAEAIENALYHENETHSFDTVLDNACARYVTEVKAAIQDVDGWRERTKAALRAKWADPAPAQE